MDTEDQIERILAGSVTDVNHIRYCLDVAINEPHDVVRAIARVWLEGNAILLAQQLIK